MTLAVDQVSSKYLCQAMRVQFERGPIPAGVCSHLVINHHDAHALVILPSAPCPPAHLNVLPTRHIPASQPGYLTHSTLNVFVQFHCSSCRLLVRVEDRALTQDASLLLFAEGGLLVAAKTTIYSGVEPGSFKQNIKPLTVTLISIFENISMEGFSHCQQEMSHLIPSPSNLFIAVKTTVRAGILRPMAKVSVANSTCRDSLHPDS